MGATFTVINTSNGQEVVVEELRHLDLSTLGNPGDEYALWESVSTFPDRAVPDQGLSAPSFSPGAPTGYGRFIASGRLH